MQLLIPGLLALAGTALATDQPNNMPAGAPMSQGQSSQAPQMGQSGAQPANPLVTTVLVTKAAVAGAAKPTNQPAMKPAGGVKHIVMVSNDKGELTFTPAVVTASVGHMVEFVFHPNNHSVAQAAFDSPCMPMDQSTSMKGMVGFYSGFMPVSMPAAMQPGQMPAGNMTAKPTNMMMMMNNGKQVQGKTQETSPQQQKPAIAPAPQLKTFTIMVKNMNPMWFYCSQGKHCQAGMAGVINPKNSTGQNLEMFQAGCKKAPMNISPAKIAGSIDQKMMQPSGAAKPSGAMMGTAVATVKPAAQSPPAAMTKMNMTMASSAKTMATSMAGAAKGMSGMAMSSTAAKASASPAAAAPPPAAAAAVSSKPANASAAKNGSTIAQSNDSPAAYALVQTGSSFGLLAALAASVVLLC